MLDGILVLVVDDTVDGRQFAANLLRRYGAAVVEAASAAEALAFLDKATPDVIVSDIRMPKQDGCELLRAIRSREASGLRHIPAAALTSQSSIAEMKRCFEVGFERFIPKAVSGQILVSVVAELGGTKSNFYPNPHFSNTRWWN